jgi:hypothetical protein
VRPITRLLILLGLILGLNEFLSLVRSNDAMQQAAIVQAYQYAVQLARMNEERRHLGLGDPPPNIPPTAEALKGTAIRSLTYERGGAMHIELNAQSGRDGGVLVYLPVMKDGEIRAWTCVTRDYPEITSILPACGYME